jgi:hypothetical protein
MNKIAYLLTLFVGALICALYADPAQAQRVFVSATGSDGNPCTFASPCRTFQHAHDTVAANGEIDVLDPAGYGSLTITKAISIQGHGFSGISAASGNAITINAGVGDKVSLRGLLIDGVGAGSSGIVFQAGSSLEVQESVIRHFTGDGIDFFTNATSSLSITSSLIADNGAHGVSISPTGTGSATVLFNRVELNNNALDGLAMLGTNSNNAITVTVTDSVFFHNNGAGVEANNCGAPTACVTGVSKFIMITNSRIVSNGVGVQSFGLSIFVYLSKSTVQSNGSTCVNGSHVWSYGDNNISGLGCTPPPLVSLN